MASAAFFLAPFFEEQTICRASKEVSTAFPGHGHSRDILKSASVLVGSPVEEKGLHMNLLPTYSLPQISIPVVDKPFLIDMQDARPDSVVFSFGIADQCARREKIRKFLFCMSNDEKVIDTSLMSDLMGLDTATIENFDMLSLNEIGVREADHILHLARHIPKPLLDFIEDRSHSLNSTVNPDGRMLLSGTESEIKDLLSIATEFNMLKSFTTSNKQSMVIPYFTRSRGGHARARSQGSISSDHVVAPLKSPVNIKLKPSPKKKGKYGSREREFYENNYFRACENFLSILVDKKRTSTAVKKSGPEITQLLSQFAAGIAGTGLAILLSIACRTANGRVSLNAAKFLSTGLGIGFLYLSWSVTGLRDTVSYITRSAGKLKLTEDEMTAKLNRSVNEVLYRAAGLVAIALLRLAYV